MRKVLILAAAVVLVAGCGGGGGAKESAGAGSSSPGGASVAPASTAFLIRLETAFDSPQWKAFDALLRKFPDGTKLYSSLGGDGVDFERDVKPALGPETDALALTTEDLDKDAFVGLTQPKDDAKFEALMAKHSNQAVSEEIANWRVIADARDTIDRFKRARNEGTLADTDAFKEASAGLPAQSLASLYLSGPALAKAFDAQAKSGSTPVPNLGIQWLSGAVTAKDQGFAVDLRVKSDQFGFEPYTAELPAEVPADVSAFVDFKGLNAALEQLRKSPALSKQLGPAEQALGGLLDDVIALFRNEGAVYLRQQPAGPEYVLVLKVTDEQGATSTLERLATLAGALSQKAPEDVTIAGVSAKKLTFGTTPVYYAVFDGKLVVTNARTGIEGLRSGGQHLADSQAWQGGKAAAGTPDATTGLLYADVQRLVPLIEQLRKKPLSAQAKRNVEPLGTAFLFGDVDGGVVSVKGFVSVR